MSTRDSLVAGMLAVGLCTLTARAAGDFTATPGPSHPSGGGPVGETAASGCGSEALTQSSAPGTVEPAGMIACQVGTATAEIGLARELTLASALTIDCVQLGITTNTGGDWPVEARIFGGDIDDPYASLVLLGQGSAVVADGTTLALVTVTLDAPVALASAQTVVVELFTPTRVPANGGDGGVIQLGGNDDGQTAASYVRSVSCGVPEYVDLADIGFGDNHLVLTLQGEPPDPCASQSVGCFTPPAWQPRNVLWSGDANRNFLDDEIEGATAPVDVILQLNGCPTDDDVARLAAFGEVGLVGRYLSIVELRRVSPADAAALAQDPLVAMVELSRDVHPALDVSNRAIRVRTSGTYAPNTVEDAYPGIDGSGVSIAIIDSGVDDGNHASLPASKFVGGYDFVTNTPGNPAASGLHGTHVAGIALGTGGGTDIVGIAPGAGLVDLRVFTTTQGASPATVIAALEMCIDQRDAWSLKVVNMSLADCTNSNGQNALCQMVNTAVSAGLVVVISAGNTNDCGLPNFSTLVPTPAAADDGISVANSNDVGTILRTDDVIYPTSMQGPRLSDGDGDTADELKPDVAAPGALILSAQAGTANGYINGNGTSMSAPHVAGLAALICQRDPCIDPLEVKQLIIDTAEDFGAAGWDKAFGHGLVDAFAAVDLVHSAPPCPADLNDDGVVNGADLGLLLGSWGPCAGCPADLNDDDVVNGADLGLLLGGWGPCD